MNVLLIVSDQETAATTRPLAHTPHRDALARRGVSFGQAYCTSPQCSPSRGTLLTGLFPHQTGVETNLDAVHARPLSPEIPTLGTRLTATGFQTGYFGKWHLSADGPGAHGFQDVGTVHHHGHEDTLVAREAAEWLAGRGEEPWCAVVSFINPHDIYRLSREPDYPIRNDVDLPTNISDNLDRKPTPQRHFLTEDQGQPFVGASEETWRRYRSAYADLLEQVDECLGTVLQGLFTGSQAERTVVVYTSDHGDLVGAHGLPYKGPCLYDELVHVPLVIDWPGLPSRLCTAPISQIDLVPTLLDAAGLAPDPALPGCSLRPLLLGDPTAPGRPIAFEYLSKQRWANPLRGIRQGHWQYNQYLWGGEELYDLAKDPGEQINLADNPTHADQLATLKAELEAWRKASGDAGRWVQEEILP